MHTLLLPKRVSSLGREVVRRVRLQRLEVRLYLLSDCLANMGRDGSDNLVGYVRVTIGFESPRTISS
jgi:hypothetical protein